ncbi:hypothetical protein ALC62_02660 [Cyphomyrmex costatus]|uniref:Uncharacterized protein n=1 Tax=Cyphomyrmex costatus TaxID=456900 RepID=A0A195D077_9HYME|nr:hypothetical protein ALC62_02660 [Cyphomyrmex costatus]
MTTGNVKLRQAWRIAQSILVVSVLSRRCRGCAQVRSSPRIVESSFAPPTSKGTSRMTIATRVLETILPIEPVPAAARARFEKMKYLFERGQSGEHERQQALVRAFVPPRCALSRGPNLAVGKQAAESRRTMRARSLIKLI